MPASQSAACLVLFCTTAAFWTGCGPDDLGAEPEPVTARALICADCDPDDPREPPPPPPPPPETVTITFNPAVGSLFTNAAFSLSDVQDPSVTLHYTAQNCHYETTPEVRQCRQDCLADDDIRLSQCLSACAELGRVCEPVCRSWHPTGHVKWGDGLKALSAPRTCDASSCPACATPREVPSLRDEVLTLASAPPDRYDFRRVRFETSAGVTRAVVDGRYHLGIHAVPGETVGYYWWSVAMPMKSDRVKLFVELEPRVTNGRFEVLTDARVYNLFDSPTEPHADWVQRFNDWARPAIARAIKAKFDDPIIRALLAAHFRAMLDQAAAQQNRPRVRRLLSARVEDDTGRMTVRYQPQ